MANETEALVEFINDTSFDKLPKPVVEKAKLSFLNYLACALGSADDPVVVKSYQALRPYMGQGTTTILGTTKKSDPISASYINCMSSAILAYDETHARSVIHPVGPVASAALALSEERRFTGKAFLRSLVLGVEASSRASLAISCSPAESHVGWSQTGVCSAIGAAVSTGVLFDFDNEKLLDSIAMSASAGSGLRSLNGTMAVVIAAASSSSNGIRSTLNADAGIVARSGGLEHPYGFIALHSNRGHVDYLNNGLGVSYAVEELNFKPYPCGIVAHASIDAALKLHNEVGISPAEIAEVEVRLHPSSIALGDSLEASTANEAMVSIQYWVATALLRADIGPDCLRDGWLSDSSRKELQAKVQLVADESLNRSTSSIMLKTLGGEHHQATVVDAIGSEANAMKDRDIEAKFARAATGRLRDSDIDWTIEACRNLESVGNLRELTEKMSDVLISV